METRRVVITGMGVVSPVGNDLETTWNNLINGVCGIAPITSFDTSDLPVKIAAELKDFDPLAAGVDKAFAKRNDRFAIYAMAAAIQAMQGNEDLQMDPSRLGVYIGSGIGGFDTILREITKMNAEGPRWVSPLMIPTMIGNMASGSVAIRYNAQGPTLPIVTACSTGTHSIGEAYRAIKHGYADAIISGGCEAGINRISIAGFANCKALTKAETRCTPPCRSTRTAVASSSAKAQASSSSRNMNTPNNVAPRSMAKSAAMATAATPTTAPPHVPTAPRRAWPSNKPSTRRATRQERTSTSTPTAQEPP